jgi:hypothetical protein
MIIHHFDYVIEDGGSCLELWLIAQEIFNAVIRRES